MDQGGELYHNPEVCKLFTQHGYQIQPTGADSSHQNSPVERVHQTVTEQIRRLLLGAHLHHSLRILNALPQRTQTQLPLQLATGRKKTYATSKLLDVAYGFIHLAGEQLNSKIILEKASSSDIYLKPQRIFSGLTSKQIVSKFLLTLVLTKA